MKLWTFISVAVLSVSCVRPASVESFVKSGDRDVYGRYPFEVSMEDSSCVYDMAFLAEMDCGKCDFSLFEGFPLRVTWMSPGGRLFAERVWLGPSALSRESHHSRTLHAPYRTGSAPAEYGKWKMYVAVPDSLVEKFGLVGMGLEVERHKMER